MSLCQRAIHFEALVIKQKSEEEWGEDFWKELEKSSSVSGLILKSSDNTFSFCAKLEFPSFLLLFPMPKILVIIASLQIHKMININTTYQITVNHGIS